MGTREGRAICWIRRDLRLADHTALSEATRAAREVAVVFVFDRCILDALQDRDDRRLTFIHRSLKEVDTKLRKAGSRLVALYGDPVEQIPKYAASFGADRVFAARDYEPYARSRDTQVETALNGALTLVKDTVVFEPEEVLNNSGAPFRVYSPYARAWRARYDARRDTAVHAADPASLAPAEGLNGPELGPLKQYGFVENSLWLEPGEAAARDRLKAFVAKMDRYPDDRNFPSQEGTSGLSVHLRFGTVSVRETIRRALERGTAGADKWLSELIWRDFYQAILYHFPHAAEQPFQDRYAGLKYSGDELHYQTWCEGRTGYPLVDAAMRCLNQTGFMHNRLRMVVASFLTKDLLIDYRRGEAYFARKLLDFDLASNNGGWQWAASTGTDPQPYFRIFNPISQSEKFDPNGEFIRRYVPELQGLTGKSIHFPAAATPMELQSAGVELGKTYPLPIVDHAVQRERAIELLRSAGSE